MTRKPAIGFRRMTICVAINLLIMANVFATETTWNAQSSDWFDPDNWSDGVPDADTDAILNCDSSSSRIVVVNDSPAAVRNLILDGCDLNVESGGSLDAASIFVEFGSSWGFVEVRDTGSRLIVTGDFQFGGEKFDSGDFTDLRRLFVRDGGYMRVDGNLELGDPDESGSLSVPRVVNFTLWGSESEVDIGNLHAAVNARSFINWREGTVRIRGQFTVGSSVDGIGFVRQFGLSLGGRFSDNPSPAPTLDMTAAAPVIELLEPMESSLIQLNLTDEEFRLENLNGAPVSLIGGFEVVDGAKGHTVSNGHHEVVSWRVDEGSAEFNGSVNGSVELALGLNLIGTAEFKRLHSEGTVQVGTAEATGTMTVSEEFTQSSAGITRLRIRGSGHDQLRSLGRMNYQGGSIEVMVHEDAQPGSYVLLTNQTGFASFAPAIEIFNDSNLVAQSTVSANQLRVELIAVGELEFDTDNIDFGTLNPGEAEERTLLLSNSGQAALLVALQVPSPSDFTITGGTCPQGFAFQLLPEIPCSVVLRFEPAMPGEVLGALAVFLPESGEQRQVELSGRSLSVGPATQMAINAGDGQSAVAGQPVADAPSVVVRDANDNPVEGVEVTFAVATGGGTVDPTTAVSTDANGIATVSSWTLGTTAGSNTLTASAADVSAVTFTATGVEIADQLFNDRFEADID